MEKIQNNTSHLYKINKGLFLALLVSILYSIPFIVNLLDLPVTYGFLGTGPISFLSTWPVIVCLITPLLFVNELRKRQIFFLVLFIPYWLFMIYLSGAGFFAVAGLYLPYIILPFIVFIVAHFVLEITTRDKTGRNITLLLIVLLFVSLSPTIIGLTKLRNVKIEQLNNKNRVDAEKKDQLRTACNEIILKNQGDLSKDACFMQAAFETRDI